MICTCLPSIRALLTRWFPSVFATTSRHTAGGYNGNTDHSWDISRNLEISGFHKGTYSSEIDDSKDKSGFKLTSVEEASSSYENVTISSTSKGDGRHGHSIPKRSDEITFFHVGEDAVPMSKFNKNHIAKQVVVTVHSTPIDPSDRDKGRIALGKGSR